MMPYLVQPREQIFMESYGLCLLLKIWVKILVKILK